MLEQKKLIEQQDAELDKLHSGVQRVKALAGVMKTELDEQNVMLDELESNVDETDSNMKNMSKKLKQVMEDAKNSDRAMYSMIGCLLLLFFQASGSTVVARAGSGDAPLCRVLFGALAAQTGWILRRPRGTGFAGLELHPAEA